jgi:3',5'-cyclic AMP phosphodiesterase CpdA
MLRVLHLTDTHVVGTEEVSDTPKTFAGAVAQIQGRTTTESLRLVLDTVAVDGFEPDLVLHTGDAADDGEPGSYVVLRKEIDSIGAGKVVVVAGNHDRAADFGRAFGRKVTGVQTTDLGEWQVVTVDTSAFGRDHGEIDATAQTALDAALSAATGHVLIGLHHPPLNPCPEPSCELRQGDELLAIIDRHPKVRAVVSGHLHVTEDRERNGVAYLLSPSTCHQLHHDHPLREHNREPTPVGTRLLELHDDGRIDSQIRWLDPI